MSEPYKNSEKAKYLVLVNMLLVKAYNKFRYSKRKFLLILVLSLIGAITGFLFAKSIKTQYKYELTFMINEEPISSSSRSNVFSGANLIALFKSRLVIEKTLLSTILLNNKKYTLLDYYIQTQNSLLNSKNNKNKEVFFPVDIERSKLTENQNLILLSIFSNLISEKKMKIQLKGRSNSIYALEIISENESFSKLFCEQLLSNLSQFYFEDNISKSLASTTQLENQVDSVKKELYNAIQNVSGKIEKHFNLNPSLSVLKSSETKIQVELKLSTSILNQLISQLEQEKIVQRQLNPIIQVIDSPRFPTIAEKPSYLVYSLISMIITFVGTVFIILLIDYLKNNNYDSLI